MWIYLNDRIVQEERARISVFDRGFLYGDGVFETVRIYDGRPVWLERHLARLARSCRQIHLPLPEKQWPAIFQKVIDKNRVDHALIRLTLSRGGEAGNPQPRTPGRSFAPLRTGSRAPPRLCCFRGHSRT